MGNTMTGGSGVFSDAAGNPIAKHILNARSVQIYGLASANAQQYNDLFCEILAWNTSKQRWVVRLRKIENQRELVSKKQLLIRPCNLKTGFDFIPEMQQISPRWLRRLDSVPVIEAAVINELKQLPKIAQFERYFAIRQYEVGRIHATGNAKHNNNNKKKKNRTRKGIARRNQNQSASENSMSGKKLGFYEGVISNGFFLTWACVFSGQESQRHSVMHTGTDFSLATAFRKEIAFVGKPCTITIVKGCGYAANIFDGPSNGTVYGSYEEHLLGEREKATMRVLRELHAQIGDEDICWQLVTKQLRFHCLGVDRSGHIFNVKAVRTTCCGGNIDMRWMMNTPKIEMKNMQTYMRAKDKFVFKEHSI